MSTTSLPRHCAACEHSFEEPSAIIHVAKDDICSDCFNTGIIPQFEAALLDEEAYPPTISGIKLNILEYAHLLPTNLIKAYNKKSEEFAVLPRARVHCKGPNGCNSFLGKGSKMAEISTCDDCHSVTCMKCRRFIHEHWSQAITQPHDCKGYEYPSDDSKHMLPEDTKGKDWQVCPGEGCGTLVTLRDGCNHVTCTIPACRMQFCFFCGKEVSGGSSGHWGVGMPCPRYGSNITARHDFAAAGLTLAERVEAHRLRGAIFAHAGDGEAVIAQAREALAQARVALALENEEAQGTLAGLGGGVPAGPLNVVPGEDGPQPAEVPIDHGERIEAMTEEFRGIMRVHRQDLETQIGDIFRAVATTMRTVDAFALEIGAVGLEEPVTDLENAGPAPNNEAE